MRFVTLNLGIGEAAALRRAVEGAIGACPCQEESGRAPCATCAALDGIRDDLGRFLVPRSDRTIEHADEDRLLTASSGNLTAHVPPDLPGLRRRLWVVPTATADV